MYILLTLRIVFETGRKLHMKMEKKIIRENLIKILWRKTKTKKKTSKFKTKMN